MAERDTDGGTGSTPGIAHGEDPAGEGLSGATALAALVAARPAIEAVLRTLDPTGVAADAPTLAAFARRTGLPLAAVIAAFVGEAPAACVRRAARGAATPAAAPEPAWLAGFAATETIDVRPLLAAHRDPLLTVLAAAARTASGGGLIIDAPFDPQPLRRVLAERGFETHARMLAAGHVRVWCRRRDDAPPPARGGQAARIWSEGSRVHIDVRGLAPPQPMTAILGLIDGGAHGGAIVVHHDRDPVYLWPELAERGWSGEALPAAPGEVRLLLRPAGD